MSENLKVNANSSVLEHKRKHNLLVDSISEKVENIIESGEVENAKPIYFHGIRLTSDALQSRITLTILNNDNTPFTSATIIPYLKELMDDGARIIANGYVIRADNTLLNVYEIGATSLGYFVYGNSTTDRLSVSLDDIVLTSVEDGVNKIN